MNITSLLNALLSNAVPVRQRAEALKLMIAETKMLYLHSGEYENGLSNQFTLKADLEDLQGYIANLKSDFHLSGFNQESIAQIGLGESLAALMEYYVDCLKQADVTKALDPNLEDKLFLNIEHSFKCLIAEQYGLSDLSIEELDVFLTLESVPKLFPGLTR